MLREDKIYESLCATGGATWADRFWCMRGSLRDVLFEPLGMVLRLVRCWVLRFPDAWSDKPSVLAWGLGRPFWPTRRRRFDTPRRKTMKMERILVPVDFSEHSLTALKYAIELRATTNPKWCWFTS